MSETKTAIYERVTFTTERKHKPKSRINISRKGSIVKERCKQLTDIALDLYPSRRIKHEDLTYLVTAYIGGDKATVRAYTGYKGYVKHSRTGAHSQIIGKPKKGYLETFGFMHKVNSQIWVIHAQSQLVPPAFPPTLYNESVEEKVSKENFSFSTLSSTDQISTERLSDCRVTENSDSAWETTTKIYNNNNTERERNFTPKIFPKISTDIKRNR